MKRLIFIFACMVALRSATAQTVPQGALPGVFKIAENKQVYFSQGNLIRNGDIWSFAENQTDVPGENGLFAWGTSGYGNPDTIPAGRGLYKSTFWDYADFDWGVYNPISNGGNTAGQWRTLKGEEWQYLIEHYVKERTTINETSGWKILADDGEHFLFLPDGECWASTSSGDLVGEKTTAEACVVKTEGIDFYGNALRTDKKMVRLVYETEDPAWVVVSDQRDNSSVLAKYKEGGGGLLPSKQVDVKVIRSLTPGMSNTLTLPFDVEEAEMATLFGEGYKLWKLEETNTGSIDVEAREFNVNLVEATSIEAGTPYLITPTKAVTNMYFYNRIIKVSTNEECIAGTEGDLVQFCGLFDRTHLEAGNKNYLFLYPNNTLVWPAENDNSSMNSLRAYFKVNSSSFMGAPLRNFAPRMVIHPSSAPTCLGQWNKNKGQRMIKVIENGQLMIIREGKTYNTQGIEIQ